MTPETERARTRKGGRRARLRRELVLRAAIELADESGLEALTMQRIGQRLGVEAMSLYRHVRNKEDILDGIVDLVFGDPHLDSSILGKAFFRDIHSGNSFKAVNHGVRFTLFEGLK